MGRNEARAAATRPAVIVLPWGLNSVVYSKIRRDEGVVSTVVLFLNHRQAAACRGLPHA